jgi:FkbM family methyltransferase
MEGWFYFEGNKLWSSSFELDWFDEYLHSLPIYVIDIGCYDCGDAIRIKQKFNRVNVYAIEASTTIYKQIKHLEKYGLNIYNFAIRDFIGQTTFNESNYNNESEKNKLCPVGSLYQIDDISKTNLENIEYKEIKVNSITVEEFCKLNNINEVDLLHVDVEGSLDEVLRGLGNIRPKMIYAEVNNSLNYKLKKNNVNIIHEIFECLGYNLKKDLGCDRLYLLNGV